jgi:hypothetical protein
MYFPFITRFQNAVSKFKSEQIENQELKFYI